jgi:hypothetical protein
VNKLKIEYGASKVRWTLLKTNIEESIANDIDLMCQWSENERKYLINELLRFAIASVQDFQKYKAGLAAKTADSNPNPLSPTVSTKPGSARTSKEGPSAGATGQKTIGGN